MSVDGHTLYQFYNYNKLGQLTAVYISTTTTKPGTTEVTYAYNADGNVANVNYRGGKGESHTYNIRNWIKSINNVNNSGSFGASYTYTKNGNITAAEYMNPKVGDGSGNQYHYGYGYDNLNRLTSATFGFGSSGSSNDFELNGISYYKSGDFHTLQRRGQNGNLIDNLTYHYVSGTDKISEVVDAAAQTPGLWDAETATYGYDANGNLTSRSDKISKISYDWRNLPIDFDLTSGQEIVDNYNAIGQRILKELKGGAWTFYVKDGNKTVAVIDQNGFNHFNLFGNKLFGRYEPSTGAHRYYLTDNLGSTRMVADNNGSVLQTFDYYPFGLLMPGRSGGSGSTMEKFTGKEIDDEAGLNLDYFGARYYDAAVGQWLSVDPKAKKYPMWSPYNYGLDNPLRFIDPNGNAPCCGYPISFDQFAADMDQSIKHISYRVNRTITTVSKKTVESVSTIADQTSNASDKTGIAGIGMAAVGTVGTVTPGAGETGVPEAAAGTGVSLAVFSDAVGTGADFVSLGAKYIDYKVFGGSKQAYVNQGLKVFVDFSVGKAVSWFIPESKSVAVKAGKEAIQMVTKQTVNEQLGIQQ